MSGKKVLVIGAGVSGLTTAYCLLENNFAVTVISDKFSPHITSVVAGALWEWPPAVCGYHHDQVSLSRSKEWCMDSYEVFFELSKNPLSGVHIRPVNFFFREKVNVKSVHYQKMNELAAKVRGFRHSQDIIHEENISWESGLVDAYQHLAPMVDTDVYMAWLLEQVKSMGAVILQQRIGGTIAAQEHALRVTHRCDFIVNCAGLGAAELAPEPMYPLRGALVRLLNDGTRIPKINQAYCVSHAEDSNDQDIVFIVPRGENKLVLGGLAEKDQWDINIGLHNYKPIQEMYDRCVKFMPSLAKMEIDSAEPVRAGLRPFRAANVRLDKDDTVNIIHNYGHGGAGVTFSWGCAREVLKMVNQHAG